MINIVTLVFLFIFFICLDEGTKVGGAKHGLFGECVSKSGNGVIALGCSLCMQVMVQSKP